MTNDDLKRLIRQGDVAAQLVRALPHIADGIQNVPISSGNHPRTLRIVRLQKIGNSLEMTGTATKKGSAAVILD